MYIGAEGVKPPKVAPGAQVLARYAQQGDEQLRQEIEAGQRRAAQFQT
jgi:hypothetical protein